MPHDTGLPEAPSPPVRIRPFTPRDRAAVLTLAERLAADASPWRDPAAVRAGILAFVEAAIERGGPDRVVLVAEAPDGRCVGFVTLERQQHWTGIVEAYLGELAVAEELEGRGVGSELLLVAEGWARQHGCDALALDTGSANGRARRLYGRLGFVEESVKLVKRLE